MQANSSNYLDEVFNRENFFEHKCPLCNVLSMIEVLVSYGLDGTNIPFQTLLKFVDSNPFIYFNFFLQLLM